MKSQTILDRAAINIAENLVGRDTPVSQIDLIDFVVHTSLLGGEIEAASQSLLKMWLPFASSEGDYRFRCLCILSLLICRDHYRLREWSALSQHLRLTHFYSTKISTAEPDEGLKAMLAYVEVA